MSKQTPIYVLCGEDKQQLNDLFVSFLLGSLLFSNIFKVVHTKSGIFKNSDITVALKRSRLKRPAGIIVVGTQATIQYADETCSKLINVFGPKHYVPNIGVFILKKDLPLTRELMTQFHKDPHSVLEYVSVSTALITPPYS